MVTWVEGDARLATATFGEAPGATESCSPASFTMRPHGSTVKPAPRLEVETVAASAAGGAQGAAAGRRSAIRGDRLHSPTTDAATIKRFVSGTPAPDC